MTLQGMKHPDKKRVEQGAVAVMIFS